MAYTKMFVFITSTQAWWTEDGQTDKWTYARTYLLVDMQERIEKRIIMFEIDNSKMDLSREILPTQSHR